MYAPRFDVFNSFLRKQFHDDDESRNIIAHFINELHFRQPKEPLINLGDTKAFAQAAIPLQKSFSNNNNNEEPTMASAQDNAKTVCLDVGGTKFRVSRSLIEQYPNTMLARLISETWNSKPNEEIFIDRDGGLFQQVLHYMRDQKVHLPVSVSKAAVLHELHYFGFENVSKEDIDVSCANFEAVEHMRMLANDHDKRNKELLNLQYFGMLAYECFEQYGRGNASKINLHRKNFTNNRLLADVEFSEVLLNDFLAEYGLKCTKVYYSRAGYKTDCIFYGPRVDLSPL